MRRHVDEAVAVGSLARRVTADVAIRLEAANHRGADREHETWRRAAGGVESVMYEPAVQVTVASSERPDVQEPERERGGGHNRIHRAADGSFGEIDQPADEIVEVLRSRARVTNGPILDPARRQGRPRPKPETRGRRAIAHHTLHPQQFVQRQDPGAGLANRVSPARHHWGRRHFTSEDERGFRLAALQPFGDSRTAVRRCGADGPVDSRVPRLR